MLQNGENTRREEYLWVSKLNPLCSNNLFSYRLIELRRECHIIVSKVTSSRFQFFMYLKISFILTNSADSDEMQHFVALHLSLHCLSKYPFRSE